MPSGQPGWSQRLGASTAPLVLGGVVAVGLAFVIIGDPNTPGHFPACPLRVLTGLACPACGVLRATHDLGHFDIAAAWAMNPVWVVLVPALVVWWMWWLARSWRGDRLPRIRPWTAWSFGAALLLFGVLRNIPALTPWLGPVAG